MSERRRAISKQAEVEHERNENRNRRRQLEKEIYRSATRDLNAGEAWWEARLAKPLVQVSEPVHFTEEQLRDF